MTILSKDWFAQNHQITRTLCFLNSWSRVTTDICSRAAWAMSIRSKGSRWWPFSIPAAKACSKLMGSDSKRALRSRVGRLRAASSASGSLPKRYLVEISHADALLTKTSLSGLRIASRAFLDSCGSSNSHQSRVGVEENPHCPHASSSPGGSGSKNASVTRPLAIPGIRPLRSSKGTSFA